MRRLGRGPWSRRGFSLIELAVVIVAVGVLIGVALDRLLPLIGRAERTAFMQTRADLQSALLLAAADRLTGGSGATLRELVTVNPMKLLLRPPPNYSGTVDRSRPEDPEPGKWCYDSATRRLLYRVSRYARGFATAAAQSDRIELRVSLAFQDRDGDGELSRDDEFEGVTLEPVYDYRWQD